MEGSKGKISDREGYIYGTEMKGKGVERMRQTACVKERNRRCSVGGTRNSSRDI